MNRSEKQKKKDWESFKAKEGSSIYCGSPITNDPHTKQILEDLFKRLKEAGLTTEGLTEKEIQGCPSVVLRSSHNLERGCFFMGMCAFWWRR